MTATADRARHLALIDDNEEFRTVIRMVAEPLSWEVHEFPNGKAFVASVGRGFEPDLIMLDMVMPDMDGIETVNALAAGPVRCPIVLMTGRSPLYTSSAGQLAEALGLGVLRVLQKPVPIAELRALLAPQTAEPGV